MPHTPFRLSTLLKLRNQTRDERRNLLAEAYRAEAVLSDRLRRTDEELDELANDYRTATLPGRIDVDRLLDHHRQESVLRAERQEYVRQQRILADEIERRRLALVSADREVRVLEKLREQQHEREDEADRRRETKQLDEFAVIRANASEEERWVA
jgi:flagellar export protein FliJ